MAYARYLGAKAREQPVRCRLEHKAAHAFGRRAGRLPVRGKCRVSQMIIYSAPMAKLRRSAVRFPLSRTHCTVILTPVQFTEGHNRITDYPQGYRRTAPREYPARWFVRSVTSMVPTTLRKALRKTAHHRPGIHARQHGARLVNLRHRRGRFPQRELDTLESVVPTAWY